MALTESLDNPERDLRRGVQPACSPLVDEQGGRHVPLLEPTLERSGDERIRRDHDEGFLARGGCVVYGRETESAAGHGERAGRQRDPERCGRERGGNREGPGE